MIILAIETSCDDTGIAVLEVHPVKSAKGGAPIKSGQFDWARKPNFKVLSNVVSSQIKIHQQYGGVFPMVATREHQKNLAPVLIKSLKEAKLLKAKKIINKIEDNKIKEIFEKEPELYKFTKKLLESYEKPEVDFIAVTYGPGLEPCLWTGVNFARALSYYWEIPIIPVNHIEAHILVNFMNHKTWNMKQVFPALSLIVSGGHTQLIFIENIGKYKIIGETRDDAAGECFDKAAKILGLEYPGGPQITALAAISQKNAEQTQNNAENSSFVPHKLPRPMMHSKDYDFSFSGLKTAVLYETRGKKLTKDYIANVCFEVQQAIIDVLLKKTIQAAKDYKVKTIILGGGVSANKELRKQFNYSLQTTNYKLNLLVPPVNLSTDNGLMIAVAGYFHRNKTTPWQKLKANANLRINR
ncbi:MAG: hypothetical protein A3D35_00930 [Candidatus Staskawiczbacteria bacterium RIFCSPHIGHO2_02_FULL_34_9]|uniref:tRNA N6-adenosine threonylcarbamoyltransferase n=1 Tax=Candidatus Staskawiczbacteria bacterium RIFCSPHIGHO2_02_FULL_34_9 TaxID=1802206 RepID=A0A1G2I2D6_9BACT|nr:MAG: hypothetical protein A3D35_00930 [Candidatus Staskawiczbacteria bacterium RIFCSPHIGHO2_02_FULL_34_9]